MGGKGVLMSGQLKDILETLAGEGISGKDIVMWANRSTFDGNPSPQHIQQPSKYKRGHLIEDYTLCLVTCHCEAWDVLVVTTCRLPQDVYICTPICDDCPTRELFLNRTGLRPLASGHLIDSWEPEGLTVNSWSVGKKRAVESLQKRAAIIELCIYAEKAMKGIHV